MAIRCVKCMAEVHCICPQCAEPAELEQLMITLEGKTLHQLRTTLEKKTKELQSLQLRSSFLCLPWDNDMGEDAGDTIIKPDVRISVQDKADKHTLYAHKFVLASKSLVFRSMLKVNVLEQDTLLDVQIDNVALPVMRAMVEFCYNADIKFTYEVTPEEVLEVAHKYRIDLLVRICEDRLVETLDKDSLLRRLKLAKKFKSNTLKAGASKYFESHLDAGIDAVIDGIELC